MVGAGLAGLVAGHALRRRGISVTVLEAERSAGGKIRTTRDQGYLFENGPQAFLDAPESALRRAIAWAALEDEVVEPLPGAAKRFVFRRGRLHAPAGE